MVIPAAVWILIVVFAAIIIRRVGRVHLPIWAIMAAGAVCALVLQTISLEDAFFSIQFDVLVFLFGMFVFGAALDVSGVLRKTAVRSMTHARTKRQVVCVFMAVTACASAFFMNDTVAIIGTPIALFCARRYDIPAKKLLLALCFAVTFGSAVTPIGNPQNLMLAMSGGVPAAFISYAVYLLVPSAIGLAGAFWLLVRGMQDGPVVLARIDDDAAPDDHRLVVLCGVSVTLAAAAVVMRIILSFFNIELSFLVIAAGAALPLLLCSRRRGELMRRVDYTTLIFFASMFILMAAVWNSGFIQQLLPVSLSSSPVEMVAAGALVSQAVSNVPFVLMVLPMLEAAAADVAVYMAAAAGCAAAGTLTILGAASTIIVIQKAEEEGETITFFEYLKAGLPVTVMAVIVYSVWIGVVAYIL